MDGVEMATIGAAELMLINHAYKASGGCEAYCELAWKLNVAMLVDDEAQRQYAAIYDRPWEPVPPIVEGASDPHLDCGTERYARSLTTTALY